LQRSTTLPNSVAMYPMLQGAMDRMQKENVNRDGTAVLTVLKVEAVKNPEQASAMNEPDPAPAGLGGIGGRLARRVMRKDKDQNDAATGVPSPLRAPWIAPA
jgi:hypothetical protein